MGISDKDYADAILQKQKKAQQQTVEQMIESIEAVTGSITLSTANYPTTVGTIARNPIIQEPYGHFKVLTEKDLKNDAMKAPLSALVDMWTVRWGGEWVSETEFQEDDFWRIALVRLTGANKLEKHNLANQYMSVYRIIE
jgi:hypothetical protein